MKTIVSNSIIIREGEEESLKGMYLYCEVIGTRWFNPRSGGYVIRLSRVSGF